MHMYPPPLHRPSTGPSLTSGVRDADVHLAVKPAKPPQGTVDAVGPVGGCHDDDVRPLLQAVHQRQQLGHDASLDFTVGLGGGREGN